MVTGTAEITIYRHYEAEDEEEFLTLLNDMQERIRLDGWEVEQVDWDCWEPQPIA